MPYTDDQKLLKIKEKSKKNQKSQTNLIQSLLDNAASSIGTQPV